MRNKYFWFLFDLVSKTWPIENRYEQLLQQLHQIEFYALVPNDDNRAADGTHLRDLFVEREGAQALSFCPTGPCTLLEMLIALSDRLEIESEGWSWYKTQSGWFWFLMHNLRLDRCTNKAYENVECEVYVSQICYTFVERKYKSNGKGGLFPLKMPKNDQKKVEIWYQMSAFLLENHPF